MTDKTTEDKGLCIMSTKLPAAEANAITTYLQQVCGVTVYEFMQYFFSQMLGVVKYEMGVTKEYAKASSRFVESFGIDPAHLGNVRQALVAFRQIIGMGTMRNEPAQVHRLVNVWAGGIVTTFDPTPTEEHPFGSVTIGKEDALRAILSDEDGRLPRALATVMADRNLRSVEQTLSDLLRDECEMIHQADDDTEQGLEMNEYGNVPKRTHNLHQH